MKVFNNFGVQQFSLHSSFEKKLVYCTFFSVIARKIFKPKHMALKQIDHGTADYKKMVALRLALLRKPLGLNFTEDELKKEKEDILIGAFEEDDILACCLLTKTEGKTLRLRQMAVQKNLQGKGIGASMMNFAETVARDKGFKKLTMHARKSALGFYEKLGYRVTGNEFEEVTIPHYMMEKSL
jgi:predicted GNAT family N-acyltransferase